VFKWEKVTPVLSLSYYSYTPPVLKALAPDVRFPNYPSLEIRGTKGGNMIVLFFISGPCSMFQRELYLKPGAPGLDPHFHSRIERVGERMEV
jgi:hypothetical protein